VQTKGELTVYVGGYVGSNYDTAAAAAVLPINSRISLGVGAKLGGGTRGEKIFGNNSLAPFVIGGNTIKVDISDWVITDPHSYNLQVTLSSDSADVDLFSGSRYQGRAGDLLSVSALGVDVVVADATNKPGVYAPITVAEGSYIEMDEGYLFRKTLH